MAISLRFTRITKSDTAGEVIFTPARTLTPQVFKGLPHVNRIYFGLRQRYQKWARAEWHEVKLNAPLIKELRASRCD